MGRSSISTTTQVVASSRQAATEVGGEAVILDFDAGIYYGLDHVGARIWQLLQTPTTVTELRDTIVAEYAVEPDRCEKDLLALLGELETAGLIDVADEEAE